MKDERFWLEPGPWRVRAIFNREVIADSRRMMLLLSNVRTPVYYFPAEDIRMDLLEDSGHTREPAAGEGKYWNVTVDGVTAERAAHTWTRPAYEELRGIEDYVTFKWDAMDAWLEEDEEVYVHPRDPYKRIDVRESSRHVVATLGGETIAETRRPRLLFETGLPIRYYFPKTDVRLDLLDPSETITRCPYKGEAMHYSGRIGGETTQDVAWSYPLTHPEAVQVRGLIAFYPKRLDALEVDGERVSTEDDPF